jgi:hypothetical protein
MVLKLPTRQATFLNVLNGGPLRRLRVEIHRGLRRAGFDPAGHEARVKRLKGYESSSSLLMSEAG